MSDVKIFPTSVTKIVPQRYHTYSCNVHKVYFTLKIKAEWCRAEGGAGQLQSNSYFLVQVNHSFSQCFHCLPHANQCNTTAGAAVEHFAAQDFYGFLSPTCKQGCTGEARDLFPGLMGSNELHLYLHTNFKTAGPEPDFGRSSRLKRMAGSKRLWVSPVTLQCVTDLLFSFKCFWDVCKLWFRYH